MKKRPLVLLVLLAVLALLLGALLLLTGGGDEEADTSAPVPVIAAGELAAIEWSNAGEEVRLEKRGGKWYWAQDDRFPVDQLKAEELAEVFTSLTSTAHIPAADIENKQDYGLHFPLRTLAAEGKDGERIVYEVGNQSPLNSSYFYACVNSSDVFLVNRAIYDDFELGLYGVIQTEEIPAFTNISSVTFETAESSAVYTRTEDGEGWLKAVNGAAAEETDTDETNALVKKLTGLKWEYCVHYAPDADERAAYGTDDPVCTVTVKHEGEDFILEIGSDADDYYTYAKLKGSEMVYLIDSMSADAFAEASK